MANTVNVYVEDVDERIANGYTTVRLYAANSPEEIATTSPAATATLVAATETYELTHAAGGAGTWYAYTIYGASPGETQLSERWRTDATRLEDVILEAARRLRRAFEGTASSDGNTTTLPDVKLADSGADANFLSGAWVFRPDAAAAGDVVRRVANNSFVPASGEVVVSRAWTNIPVEDERYMILGSLPPIDWPGASYSWAQAVNDGLRQCYFYDELNLGEGATSTQQEFSLAPFAGFIGDPWASIAGVYVERTVAGVASRTDFDTGGRFWTIRGNGPRDRKLWLSAPPGTSGTVLISVLRRGEQLYDLNDVTTVPPELAITATMMMAMLNLNAAAEGGLAVETKRAIDSFYEEQAFHGPAGGKVAIG